MIRSKMSFFTPDKYLTGSFHFDPGLKLFPLQDSEEKCILQVALYQGAKESLEETKSMIKMLVQDMLPRNIQTIENEIKEAEIEIRNTQSQSKSLVKECLKPAVEKKITGNCSKILSEDLKIKIERQKYMYSQLKTILDFLLELSSCQELLG